MATTQQTAGDRNPTRALIESNVAFVNTLVEAGYKAQTRTLNMARVFVEGAGRQQQNASRLVERLVDPSLPWYAPERYNAYMKAMVENQNEVLRIGREFIDEMNAAAAETRQTAETLTSHVNDARQVQQALFGEGFNAVRHFATDGRVRPTTN